jgi:exopolysaccharide biosynthesis polyprenyl glycosylphosphotransferase
MYVVFILLVRTIPTPVPLLVMCLVQFGVGVIWVLEVYRLYFVVNKPKKTVLVCDMRHDIEELMERYELDNRYKVIKSVEINEALNDIEECLGEAENVFLCGIHSHDRNVIIKYCVEKDVSVFVIPRVGDVLMSGAENMHLLHLPVMKLGRYSPIPEYIILKRAFDIFVSLLGIIVTSPVLIITAIAIKASDGGSAFYKQVRLTKDGKEFKILKFRSMKMDAEKYSGAVLSSGEDDPRLTKVGKFIRKVRIDELPQLFNILKGEMSVVGPRPERPEIAAQYEKELPEFSLRLQVKAGLTGYAQVYGKYNTTPYDKLLMDLMYIAKPSIIQDLMIMLATVKILFEKESTEGVEGGDISSNPK